MKPLRDFKKQIQDYLLERHEVVFALLYGSALERKDFADLDIGIYVDRQQVPGETDLDYAISLTDELSMLLGFPVDVRVINDAPLGFQYNVSRGQPLLVRDEEALARFRERTWDMWFDFEPVARLYLKEMQ